MLVRERGGTRDEQALRVLLVEDSATDRELVRRALVDPAPLSGPVHLETVSDADAALDAVRRATFSVVLTDYSLPGRTGLDLLRQLRETDGRTPVVVMTGTGDEAVAVAALQLGAADYIVKELGFDRTLPVVIDRVLRRSARVLERECREQEAAEYTRQLERKVDEQTSSLRRALQESEALRRVGQALAAARELKPAVDLVTETTAQLVRAHAAAIMIRTEADLVLVSVWGPLKQPPGSRSAGLPAALSAGWQETAAASLLESETELGLLWVGRSRLEPFSSREVELLETLAHMTALSIANVRAHEQLRRRDADPPPAEKSRPQPAEEHATTPVVGAPPERVDTGALVIPPFPAALARLLALTEDENATPQAIEAAVGLDPALATRAIQLASTHALGRARRAASLREAVMVLGMRGVRNAAFAQFSRQLAVRGGVFDQLLWQQSLATAVCAQLVVERTDRSLADDAYLCGLLHNVGAVALNNAHPGLYQRAVHLAIAGQSIVEAEQAVCGRDGASVTRELVSCWGLPAGIAGTLKRWGLEVRDTSPTACALRWASVVGLQISPLWRRLLGDRAEPTWIGHQLEAAETSLGLSKPVLEELRRLTTARCEALGWLAD